MRTASQLCGTAPKARGQHAGMVLIPDPLPRSVRKAERLHLGIKTRAKMYRKIHEHFGNIIVDQQQATAMVPRHVRLFIDEYYPEPLRDFLGQYKFRPRLSRAQFFQRHRVWQDSNGDVLMSAFGKRGTHELNHF